MQRNQRDRLGVFLAFAAGWCASPAFADPPAAFQACAACHAVAPNAPPGLGPNLHGVYGRRAATQPGYSNYSQGLRQSGVVWSHRSLQRFLENPAAIAPGTTMPPAAGMSAAERDEVISYLAQLR